MKDRKPYFTETTIEGILAQYPAVNGLINESSNMWVNVNDTQYLSLKNLCLVFEKVDSAGEEADRKAIYQAITNTGKGSLLSFFFEANPKYSREDVVRVDGSNNKFCPRDLVSDFIVFCVDRLDSGKSRSQVRIKVGPLDLVTENVQSTDRAFNYRKDEVSTIKIWPTEVLIGFFNSKPGEELSRRAKDQGKHTLLRKENETVDFLYANTPGSQSFYWELKSDGVNRTPVENLTRMIFANGEGLSDYDQSVFFEKNLNVFWQVFFGKNLGQQIGGYDGIFLSKEEFIDAVYVLKLLLTVKKLNPDGLAIAKEIVDLVTPMDKARRAPNFK